MDCSFHFEGPHGGHFHAAFLDGELIASVAVSLKDDGGVLVKQCVDCLFGSDVRAHRCVNSTKNAFFDHLRSPRCLQYNH